MSWKLGTIHTSHCEWKWNCWFSEWQFKLSRQIWEKALLFKAIQLFQISQAYIWNRDIIESSCLSEVCENACLIAKRINKSLKLTLSINLHHLVERLSCSRESDCMNSKYDSCSTPLNGKVMAQHCLKTKSHWITQTMMLKRKPWHFIVREKPKEPKDIHYNWWRQSMGKCKFIGKESR